MIKVLIHPLLLLVSQGLTFGQMPQNGGISEVEPDPIAQYKQLISGIAEKENQTADDFAAIGDKVLELGSQAVDHDHPNPYATIEDALKAVDYGEKLNSLATDWETMRRELEKLMTPPDNSEQSQQSQNDDGEPEDKQSGEQGDENESGENDGQENQESQDSESGENKTGSEQDQQSSDQESAEQGEEQQQGGEQESQNRPNPEESKLGNMDTPNPEDLEDGGEEETMRPQKPQQMQQIGGQKPIQEAANAQEAMALQQLDKIKQQDDPGKLFMLLQQSEADETDTKQNRSGKDW